ncbi:energy-coupling factor transporter transmembrane component T family protein [Paenibacillus pinistramenti]|uniref:energy-coupling factor transporter transmembrane component T family protein n=1 Tax=Paenibacillus pinistramenti TaxID=1768003 RepID=UPI001109A152|nr:energy-coupling factor transporter transmembrane component T [Paenibacillus pinistramenti]
MTRAADSDLTQLNQNQASHRGLHQAPDKTPDKTPDQESGEKLPMNAAGQSGPGDRRNAAERSLLSRTDPLSKLIMLLCAAALAVHISRPLASAVLLGLLWAASFWLARMPLRNTASKMAVIALFAVPLFVLTVLASPSGRLYAGIGPVEITSGGVEDGLTVALRLGVLFLSSMIYIETTEPRDFIYMLARWFRVPYRLAFGISVALAFIPLLEQEGRVAAAASAIRSGRPPEGLKERIARMRRLAGGLFTASVRRVQQTAGAMDVKGFGAYEQRTFLHEITLSRWGLSAAICGLAATIGFWSVV